MRSRLSIMYNCNSNTREGLKLICATHEFYGKFAFVYYCLRIGRIYQDK